MELSHGNEKRFNKFTNTHKGGVMHKRDMQPYMRSPRYYDRLDRQKRDETCRHSAIVPYILRTFARGVDIWHKKGSSVFA